MMVNPKFQGLTIKEVGKWLLYAPFAIALTLIIGAALQFVVMFAKGWMG